QGSTLGPAYKHWLRAKFFQQYRLFFRYHKASKAIVYAWVNDEDTKRAYDSPDDAYRVFRAMLQGGNPPDSWDALLTTPKAPRRAPRRASRSARAARRPATNRSATTRWGWS
ncbi:MAG: type II toxin-antitoxin system YhaV family toxin, partial [Deltaproteobacteria bacterium]|nr:type II toxin-antitoxin system YhaV family toxin [Deltaproteobacteria bacterium]